MTTPTPAQQLEEVLARVDAGVAGYGLDAADFLILNARLLRRALAALEAVEGASKADTIAYSRPPMRAVTGIAVDDDRLTPLIGTRVLIIPADAVEVKS